MTLEAMLSSKPVITCTDSGRPVEFVKDGETGCGRARSSTARERRGFDVREYARTARIGHGARALRAGSSWDQVVERLLA